MSTARDPRPPADSVQHIERRCQWVPCNSTGPGRVVRMPGYDTWMCLGHARYVEMHCR